MAEASNSHRELPEQDRQQVQAWVQDFVQNWDEGLLPSLAGRLPPAENPLRRIILRELVKIDQEQLEQRGKKVDPEAYRKHFPELDMPVQPVSEQTTNLGKVRSLPVPVPAQEPACNSLGTTPKSEHGQPAVSPDGAAAASPDQAAARSRPLPSVETYQAPAERPPTELQFSLKEAMPQMIAGRYRILRTIGKGGMGRVYLAQDTQLDRPVALKVPFVREDDPPELLRRFYREARAAATLQHPNICPVYDVGEFQGVPYITMAYIEGQSLTAVIKGGRQLPQREAAALIRQVALAMYEAHQRGIIHRDLKPSNILINQRGEPVVMDFGVARQINQKGERLTQSGRLLGTPEYMAPEQARGDIEATGPASDIYSLGVILYRLLAGKLPFEGNLTDVLIKITTTKPVAPSTYRPDLDPRLEEICKRAMSRRLESRYQSMLELATALEEFLRDTATSVLPPSARLALAEAAPQEDQHSARTAATGGTVRPSLTTNDGSTHVSQATGQLSLPTRVGWQAGTRRHFRAGVRLVVMVVLVAVAGTTYWATKTFWITPQPGPGPAPSAGPVSLPTPPVRDEKQVRFEGALEAMKHQAYDQALADFSEVIKADPGYGLAYQERGRAYHLKGDLDKALDDYNQALKLPGQHHATTHRLRGEIYLAKKDDTRAIADLNEAIKQDDKDAAAYAARATAYLGQKKYDQAIQDALAARRLNAGLGLDTELIAAYTARGQLRLSQMEYNQALRDFTEALLLEPKKDRDILHLGLGDAHRGAKNYPQALNEYMNAWRIHPQSPAVRQRLTEAYQRLAQEFLDRKNYKDAIDDFTARLANNKANYWAYYQRGRAYQARGEPGDLDRAIADFTLVQRNDPGLAADVDKRLEELYLRLADTYALRSDKQKYDHAITDFSNRLQEDGKNYLALVHRGRAYYLRGQPGDRARALADLNEAIKLHNNYALAFRYRGDAYAQGQEWDNAGPDLRKALDLNREDVRNWFQYMHWLLDRHDLPGYRKYCKELLEQFKHEKDPIHLNLISWLCVLVPETLANPRQAVELAELAWKTNQNDRDVLIFLNTLAAACYRAQLYDQAAKHLENILTARTQPDGKIVPALDDAIFLGLTYSRQKDRFKEGQIWLERALKSIDKNIENPATFWQRRVALQHLKGEVEAAMKKGKT